MEKINFKIQPGNGSGDGKTAANALAKQVGNKQCVVTTEVVREMFRCDTAEAQKIIIDAMKKNDNIIFVP